MDTLDKVIIVGGIAAGVGILYYGFSKISHPTVEVGDKTFGNFFGGIGSVAAAFGGAATNASGGNGSKGGSGSGTGEYTDPPPATGTDLDKTIDWEEAGNAYTFDVSKGGTGGSSGARDDVASAGAEYDFNMFG
jgi:hypothetical protein